MLIIDGASNDSSSGSATNFSDTEENLIELMIQPIELNTTLPMKVANDMASKTNNVWNILSAIYEGDLEKVKKIDDYPKILHKAGAQYRLRCIVIFDFLTSNLKL